MRDKIIARDKYHLIEIVGKEMELNGNNCDLNHIDVSQVTDMNSLFQSSTFDGNISRWDVSNVKTMEGIFYKSDFNGDISNWDVSNVELMNFSFKFSKFNGDLSSWKPFKLESIIDIFYTYVYDYRPYWARIDDQDQRNMAINNYWLKKELEEKLNIREIKVQTPKI